MLLKYLYKPSLETAYAYPVVVLYSFSPFILLCLLPFVFLHKSWPSLQIKRTYVYFLFFNIMSIICLFYFFRIDANKVPIVINNLSEFEIDNIKIEARNNQRLSLKDIKPESKSKVYCNCRDVISGSDDGVRLIFDINKTHFDRLLYGANSNLFDQQIEIRIVNDSTFFQSHEYGDDILWSKLDSSSLGLLEWKEWNLK